MKLRNKKTGEILGSLGSFIIQNPNGINCESIIKYNSLAELAEEWEDVPEEPKVYWYIMDKGDIRFTEDEGTDFDNNHKEIGNYFETKEEAEKAMEKLKAWKRLKDKGFRFTSDLVYGEYYGCGSIRFIIFPSKEEKYVKDDLELLFGGKE